MNAKIRNAILLTCSASAPVVAVAQTENAQPPGGTIEEIVVTAQKRVERLADIPVAASVLSPSVAWGPLSTSTLLMSSI